MAWLPACLIWTAFVGVLLWVMQCVNVVIRKQWTESESLGYPLVKLPIELTSFEPNGKHSEVPLTRNRLFWLGFAIAATMDLINSLHYYYPSLPHILSPGNGAQTYDLAQYITVKPWSAIGWMPLTFYPFVIGIGMLLPMDFLFSAWFFYLFWKLELVACFAGGFDADTRMPYTNYQAFGAYIMFFGSTIAISRKYLGQVFAKAMGEESTLDDSDEPLSYRAALLGIAVGLAILIWFASKLGLSMWLGLLFFVIYFALALAITRMRAEMGMPVHDLHYTGPDWTLSDLFGPQTIGQSGLGAFSLFYFFNRAYRSHPMPFQLEGLKLAAESSGKKEMLAWIYAMLLAGIFGMLCAFWALLHLTYINGNPMFGNEAWDRLVTWTSLTPVHNGSIAIAIIVGFSIAALLQFCRMQGFWWPFHPLAFAVSSSWEMNLLWMPIMIAWATKGLLLRYGGGQTFQKSLPFFYGLILGQFMLGSLLNIWGIITNTPTYLFWQ
jgi:type IV secretory pathway TrbD component